MPTYTSNSPNISPAETGVAVTNSILGDTNGNRLMFQTHSRWILIPGAGQINQALAQHDGIYTKGQMQCMAIIVARFSGPVWTEASLAHVSHPNHSLINTLLDFSAQHNDCYVAIGGKPASLNWMNQIRARFAAQQSVQNTWIYVGGQDSPDFGMNKYGYFGETVSWVRGHI